MAGLFGLDQRSRSGELSLQVMLIALAVVQGYPPFWAKPQTLAIEKIQILHF